MMRFMASLLTIPVMLLSACGEDPNTMLATDDVALQVQTQVFNLECANCHYDTFVDPVLTDKGSVATHLVWRFSSQNPHMYRIKPGDPDNSWLMVRMRGEQGTDPMPPGDPLPQEQIDLVASWIEDGARITPESEPIPEPTYNLPPREPMVLVYRDYDDPSLRYDFQAEERRPFTIRDGDQLTFFFYMVDSEDQRDVIEESGQTYAYFQNEVANPRPDRFFGNLTPVDDGPLVGQWEGQRYNYRLDWDFALDAFFLSGTPTTITAPSTLQLVAQIRDSEEARGRAVLQQYLLVEDAP